MVVVVENIHLVEIAGEFVEAQRPIGEPPTDQAELRAEKLESSQGDNDHSCIQSSLSDDGE